VGGDEYLATFSRVWGWFHGRNSLGIPLVNASSGGCYDGLHAAGANKNQGAESTLAYLWSQVLSAEVTTAVTHESSEPALRYTS